LRLAAFAAIVWPTPGAHGEEPTSNKQALPGADSRITKQSLLMASGIKLKARAIAVPNQIFSIIQRPVTGYFDEAFKRTANS
jgi:hypothetical protein